MGIGLVGAVLVVASYVPPVADANSAITVFAIGLVVVLYAVAAAGGTARHGRGTGSGRRPVHAE